MIFAISTLLTALVVGLAAHHANYPMSTWWVLLAAYCGACVGSFLNVVAYRLPIMLKREYTANCRDYLEMPAEPVGATFNLAFPKSHCPCCKRPIKARELLPVVSYAALRGRCAGCHNPIGVRYPVVELTCAALTAVTVSLFGMTWLAGAACVFIWTSAAIALIDADTFTIPDELSLPLLWACILATALGVSLSHSDPYIGAAVGYGFPWVMGKAYKLVRGKEGMGAGDFKYLAAIGAFLGWQAVFLVVVVAGISGTVGGMLRAAKAGRQSLGQPLPFGPHLVAGALIVLLGHPWFVKVKFLSALVV